MKRSCCAVILVCFMAYSAASLRAQNILRPYPFTMSARDTASSPFLPTGEPAPAGSHGALSVSPDGHIVTSDNTRLKFFGTALFGNSQFLVSSDARTVAARLRKLGFNCVHFAYNDYTNIDDASFFKYRDSAGQINKSSYVVNPIQLAKFDTLFADLKKNGIYTDLSLMSNHKYLAGDGLMYVDSVYASGVLAPLIDPAAAHLEREWARTLLTHRNSITGLRYADDPAFAILEDNYENSLYYYWNSLDRLIYIDQNNYNKGKNTISWNYSRRLDTLYSNFLQAKYGSEQNLKNAWGGNIVLSTKELLGNASFEDVFSTAWVLTNRSSATAVVTTGDGGVDSLLFEKVRINALSGQPAAGDINYTNATARLGKDTLYTISLWAKMNFDAAKLPGKTGRNITVSFTNLSAGSRSVVSQVQKIDTTWRQYTYFFRATGSGLYQLAIQCGAELGDVWLDAASVKMRAETPLGATEHLATSTVLRLRSDASLRLQPLQRVRDQLMFYDGLEKSFFASMDKLVKDTLHFSGLVNHRQNSFWQLLPDVYAASAGDVMVLHQANDFSGARSGQSFTDSTWMIRNTAMSRSKSSSVIGFASAGAVKGKPFILGDFQVPWPNIYSSEQMVLIPAWADYQDWDGIFFGPYAASRSELFADSLVNPFKVGGSFNSIVNNPSTLALAPLASAMFRQSMVSVAGYTDSIVHDADDVWLSPVFTPSHGNYGSEGPLDNNIVTQMRLRQSFNSSRHKLAAEYPYLPDTAAKHSDTKELYWDQTNGLFTIATSNLVGACGTFGHDTTVLPVLSFARSDAAAGKDQLSMLLMSTDGKSLDSSSSMLLAITTRAQNTGIVWIDSNGFGKRFGTAPTVMSAATLTLTFETSRDTLIVTPLDGKGAAIAGADITSVRATGAASISVRLDQQQTKSPWYVVTLKDATNSEAASGIVHAANAHIEVFPNPATSMTTAKCYLARPAHVRLEIFDALGHCVRTPFDAECADAVRSFQLDLTSLPDGVYVVRATVPDGVVSQRFLKLQ